MNHSRERDGWPDPATAERLLSGAYADAGLPGTDTREIALARLLTAAAEPCPGAPEHERAALAAFRQARESQGEDTDARTEGGWRRVAKGLRVPGRRTPNTPGPDGGGPPAPEGRPTPDCPSTPGGRLAPDGPRTPGGRRLTPNRSRTHGVRRPVRAVLGAVVAVFALGGVALAAQTGTLPHPFHRHHPAASPSSQASSTASAPGTPGASGPGATATPGAPGYPAATPAHSAPTRPPLPSGPSASPGIQGLCAAYAKATAGEGPALDAASRIRLEQAAGGPAEVPAYCAGLIAAATPGPAAPSPAELPSATAPAPAPTPTTTPSATTPSAPSATTPSATAPSAPSATTPSATAPSAPSADAPTVTSASTPPPPALPLPTPLVTTPPPHGD